MGTTSTFSPPANSKTFIDGVLVGIGAPVNPQTEQSMRDWLANEQGGPSLPDFAHNQGNPLGVQTNGAQLAGASGNLQAGIDATVMTLRQSNYQNLVAAFRQGTSTSAINEQIVASPWNGSHYGGIKVFTATANNNGYPSSWTPAAVAIVQKATTPSGCGSKTGSNQGEPHQIFTIPHTSSGLTYCQAKGILGGLALFSGGVIIVIGLASLIVGSLGGRGKGAAAIAPVILVAKAGGRGVRAVKPSRSRTPAPAQVETETSEEAA